jgi:aminopeptidase N
MAEVWLKQASYPKIAVKSRYEDGNFYLDLEQSGFEAGKHWEFPFAVALCDQEGAVLAEQCFDVKEARAELVFRDVAEPAFASLNRGFSVFGKVNYAQDSEELYLQVRKDGDCAARFVAFNKLAEAEKMRLLEDPAAKVDEKFVDLYFELLSDEALMAELAGNFLVMFDQVEDERFAHDYEALYQAGRRVRVAIAEKYRGELIKLYENYAAKAICGVNCEAPLSTYQLIRLRRSLLVSLQLILPSKSKNLNEGYVQRSARKKLRRVR